MERAYDYATRCPCRTTTTSRSPKFRDRYGSQVLRRLQRSRIDFEARFHEHVALRTLAALEHDRDRDTIGEPVAAVLQRPLDATPFMRRNEVLIQRLTSLKRAIADTPWIVANDPRRSSPAGKIAGN